MINNFSSFSSCPLMNMNNIYRYSGVKMSEQESLSSHIVEVEVMGYMLIDTLINKYGEDLDYGIFLEKAFHHDLEESLTGDVSRPLKYRNEKVLHELKVVADLIAKNIYNKYFIDSERFYKIWCDSKEGKEGTIVKIVDMLVVASKAFKEVSLLNNNYFLKVVYEVNKYLSETIKKFKDDTPFNAEATKYLVDIMEEANSDLSKIWEERGSIASKFSITDTTLVD